MSRVGFVAGTLASDKVPAFERLLFRATRGNVFLRQVGVGSIITCVVGGMVVWVLVILAHYVTCPPTCRCRLWRLLSNLANVHHSPKFPAGCCCCC